MSIAGFDLSTLPPPQTIEEFDAEAILAEIAADAIARADLNGVNLRGIITHEAEPMRYLAEACATREMRLRGRINDAYRANLILFARGSDLDHQAAFYDSVRLPGEDDERFRWRIILAIQGRSPGGTAPRYKSVVLATSLRVADAIVWRVGLSPLIRIAVYAADNGGVADPALLQLVYDAVHADPVIMVNDTIEVVPAVFTVRDIHARLWLLPDTSAAIATAAPTLLRNAWDRETGLGFDLTRSWINGRLMALGGLHSVEVITPAVDIEAPEEQAISLGQIQIEIAGRRR
ncbi:hypothetical protein GCM10019059_34950 [Camelimonas fluminis]|uniref:Baseplate J/gp47 family protein n=1 Tax=Camelimonas fluminis TaxID=1576911 RepID=A0ABV7UG80_9HYPH|nr:baseplate J/gp47 family protein [Camelimonas fluminis]GHE72307.1 hypothetical protein GCM10019059_34950 [Camelimonas fluminis]